MIPKEPNQTPEPIRASAPRRPSWLIFDVGQKKPMEVVNIHERELRATRQEVGALVASLSSRDDVLWPRYWPPMKFDRPLCVGAVGGHGPIRYFVEAYSANESIRFRFTGPEGFDGYHGYEICCLTETTVLLRHTLKMKTRDAARVSWPLVFRPLHDALIEDSLATAEASLAQTPHVKKWSAWVRLLRWSMSGGRAPKQKEPNSEGCVTRKPSHDPG